VERWSHKKSVPGAAARGGKTHAVRGPGAYIGNGCGSGGGCSCRDRAGLSLAMMAKWQEARCEIVAKDTKTRVVELVREETLRPCG